jgi:hypothetical protein
MEKFKLIEGVFNAKDAREVLLTLIDKKIKFHELKSFSSEIKFGKADEESLQRVNDLTQTRQEIIKYLRSKINDELAFNIKSFIEINEVEIKTEKVLTLD